MQRNKQKRKLTFEMYSKLPICEHCELVSNQLCGPLQKTYISHPQPSAIYLNLTLSCCCHCSTENLLKISFWQLARKHTLLSAASHQGFVRQACSEPRAFKAPIMQQDSAGQKEQECFRQSCGHTGIIHSSVAL